MNAEQAKRALAYLRQSFPGWSNMNPAEERSHLRSFAKFGETESFRAIESLKSRGRRPSPAEIEREISHARDAARDADSRRELDRLSAVRRTEAAETKWLATDAGHAKWRELISSLQRGR